MNTFLSILFLLISVYYYKKYRLHKKMHHYYREESKKHFSWYIKALDSVLKSESELMDKINSDYNKIDK